MAPRQVTRHGCAPLHRIRTAMLLVAGLPWMGCHEHPETHADASADAGPLSDAEADLGDAGAPVMGDAEAAMEGGDPEAGVDGSAPPGPKTCKVDTDCDDGVACNGAEICVRGEDETGTCEPGISRCPPEHPCIPALDACDCSVPDFDRDGDKAEVCGGNDCNDNAVHIHVNSGNEVCDPFGIDEDCDPTTYGAKDNDGDGFHDMNCFNVDWKTGEKHPGGVDCDDNNPSVHPLASEVCDYFDNNCNGLVDEDQHGTEHGMRSTFYLDEDGDGHGKNGSEPVLSCFFNKPDRHVEAAAPSDPDDLDPNVYDGAPEICDGKDNDGNGLVDAADPELVRSSYTFAETDLACQDGQWVITSCPRDRLWCPDRVQCPAGQASCPAQLERGCDVDATRLSSCRACNTDCRFACGLEGCDEVTALSAGRHHTCAITTEGRAACWGRGALGRLGNDRTNVTTRADLVVGLTNVHEIAAGTTHTCAIAGEARTLYCWGSNASGQLGSVDVNHERDEYTTVPLPVDSGVVGLITGDPSPYLRNVTSVAVGEHHTCAVLASGRVACFGQRADGRLGNNDDTPSEVPSPTLVFGTLGWVSSATQVVAGAKHSCAIVDDGRVGCWGDNTLGQLGQAPQDLPRALVWTEVPGLTEVTALSAGDYHTCAISQGQVLCWGDNSRLQLGRENDGASHIPEAVSGLGEARSVSAGPSHTCALTTDARVACWGSNDHGELGTDEASVSAVPHVLEDLEHVDAIATGASSSCALSRGSLPVCWGDNAFGQLGSGTSSIVPQYVPQPIRSLYGSTP